MILNRAFDLGQHLDTFIKADGYRKLWKLVQNLADQFWSKCLKLCLLISQSRQKWFVVSQFSIGDIVLIANKNHKHGK